MNFVEVDKGLFLNKKKIVSYQLANNAIVFYGSEGVIGTKSNFNDEKEARLWVMRELTTMRRTK